MMQTAIPILQQITKFFDSIGEFAKSNPQAMQNIGNGILVLGGSLAAASGLALAAAIGPAGWLVLGIWALGAAFVAFPETKFEDFTGLMKGFGDWLAGGVVRDIELMISLLDKLAKTIGGFIDSITKAVGGLFSKTSFEGGGFGAGGMFHNASFGGNPMPAYGSLNASQKEVVDYIKASAVARGIDPDIAVRVAASEGLGGYVGDHGTSFGPFQLHRGGAGSVGTEFEKHTGLNLQNRGTWKSQVDYALSTAARQGWSAWHGWHGSSRAGLGGAHSRPVPPHSRSAPPVHIENVMVLDGKEIARNTTKHMVTAATHPTTGPYHDGSRHWTPPDSGLIGV
jgi:hypothetical protein